MRFANVLVASTVGGLAISKIVLAETRTEDFRETAPLPNRSLRSTQSNDASEQFLTTPKTDDAATQEERFLNFLLGKVGSVIESESAVRSAAERLLFTQRINSGLIPSKLQENGQSKEFSTILRQKGVNNYLKAIIEYERSQPGSTIPMSALEMHQYELWVYAGLTPSQVRVNILKKRPSQSLFGHWYTDEYLRYIVELKKREPGSTIAKEVSEMQRYELWINAGYTPSEVKTDIFGNMPIESIMRHKDVDQYLRYIVELKKREPDSGIMKEVSEMERYELWIYAGLTPSQVRVDILEKEPSMKAHYLLRHKDADQYLKYIVELKKRQPDSTITKEVSEMETYELWIYAGWTPDQVREGIFGDMSIESMMSHKDVDQYLRYVVELKKREPYSGITKEVSEMEKYELWINAGWTPDQVRKGIFRNMPKELMKRHSSQYLKYTVEYKKRQPGSTITKEVSDMERYELWINAGYTPSKVTTDIFEQKPIGSTIRRMYADQFFKFHAEYKKRQPDSTITKEVSEMENYELWICAELPPDKIRLGLNEKNGLLRPEDIEQWTKYNERYEEKAAS